MPEEKNIHMKFKTAAKLMGLTLGIIFVLLDVLFAWIPSGGITIAIVGSTIGGFVVLVVVIPLVVYISDFLHVLFNNAKEM